MNRVPASKKFLGTDGYRVPARKLFLVTDGYRVSARNNFLGTDGYWVLAKFSTMLTPGIISNYISGKFVLLMKTYFRTATARRPNNHYQAKKSDG